MEDNESEGEVVEEESGRRRRNGRNPWSKVLAGG